MLETVQQISEAATAVEARFEVRPKVGVILGSGLAGLARQIESPTTIPYAEIPHFPKQTTALGHRGELVVGELGGVPVAAFAGRFHLYEGHAAQTAAAPVRLLQGLGVDVLVVTNAAGGLNPSYQVGDLMLIDDQINLQFANPLVGVNDDQLGPRFPDMSMPYDEPLQRAALVAARRHDTTLHRGVYAAVLGPNYETRAEQRMLRLLGVDAVGMSTVPETIAARHAGMRVLGISTITNLALPDALEVASGHHVVEAAAAASDRLVSVCKSVIDQLDAT